MFLNIDQQKSSHIGFHPSNKLTYYSNSEDNNVFKHCKTFEKQHQLSSEPMTTIAGPSTSRGNQCSWALSFLNWALHDYLYFMVWMCKYCQIFIWGQILQNKHFQLTAKLGQWAAWSWNVTQIVMSAFKCAKNISLNFILKCVIIIQDLSSHENSLV